MAKHLLLCLCFLMVFVAGATPSVAQLELRDVCESVPDWFPDTLSPELLELFCTIGDESEPVNIELSRETMAFTVDNESAGQARGLPDEVRQQLLLLLALWSPR